MKILWLFQAKAMLLGIIAVSSSRLVTPAGADDAGAPLRHSETMHRQAQIEGKPPKINEVMFLPNATSTDLREQRKFVEIYIDPIHEYYNTDPGYNLSSCRIESDDGSFRVDFGPSITSVEARYTFIVVKHKDNLNKKSKLMKSKGILWVQDFVLKQIDSVALICNDAIVDFVAWGKDGQGPDGPVTQSAVRAGMWPSRSTFVETGGNMPLEKGETLGRDRFSTDTDTVDDWNFPGGSDARGATPSFKNMYYYPLINEILIPNVPNSPDIEDRQGFIEIYRPKSYISLKGCSLVNDNKTFRVDFTKHLYKTEYLTVQYLDGLGTESRLDRNERTLFVRNFDLSLTDSLALICNGEMVDYVAWGYWNAPSGDLHDQAKSSDMWSDGGGIDDYVDLRLDYSNLHELIRPLQAGETFGRDKDSSDTDSPGDWEYPGGLDSRSATPGERNRDYTSFQSKPVINEVMFLPNTTSTDLREHRKFVEICCETIGLLRYSRYLLSGCILVNHDESFRVELDSLDSINASYQYIIIEEKDSLETETELAADNGILWMQKMNLEFTDSLGLFCDGNMIDFVAWGTEEERDAFLWNDRLAVVAYRTGMWPGTGVFVDTESIQAGQSLGRSASSTDSNREADWTFPGGENALYATPGSRNTFTGIRGIVFEDVPPEGWRAIVGIDVVITDSMGKIFTLTTDEKGRYTAEISAGLAVTETDESALPPGYEQTTGSNPTTVDVPVDRSVLELDGYYFPPPTAAPTAGGPTNSPTQSLSPSVLPSASPSGSPTYVETPGGPTDSLIDAPTPGGPIASPTGSPTLSPTGSPTSSPTKSPV